MGAIATRPQGSVGNLLGDVDWDARAILVASAEDSNVLEGTSVLIDEYDNVTGAAQITAEIFTDGVATLEDGAITGLTQVNSVTATELSQLETIGGTTISAGQWGYLGELDQSLTQASSPTFVGATFSGLTASRLVGTSAGKALQSEDLASWVTGTANQITVGDDADGTITLSGPQDLAAASSPTFTGLTLSGLTASRLVGTSAGSVLQSEDLVSWVTGTANQVAVADDADGTITLSTPQDIAVASSPTFVGLTLSGLTASRLVGTSAGSVIQSEDLASWVTGTANRVTVADDADGTITLSGPQDIDATASPTFVGLTLSGGIASPTSITMAEDAWIGIAGPAERLVFDGTGGLITFTDTEAMILGANKFYVRDAAIGFNSVADSYLDVFADGAVRITSPITYVSGDLGVGIATPEGKLNVWTGSAGAVAPNAAADEIVIEGDGHMGIHLLSPDANRSQIYFGSPAAAIGALVRWSSAENALTIGPVAASDVIYLANGPVGIHTVTAPHGGIGAAMLAIEGTNANVAGPHIQFTTASDNYPLLSIVPWAHDDVSVVFDAYRDAGGWKSSENTANFLIQDATNVLRFAAESGIAAGAAVTWAIAFQIEADAEVLFSPAAARRFYIRDPQIGIASLNDSYLDFDADGGFRFHTSDVDIFSGELRVGELGVTKGVLRAYGDPTGSVLGGQLILHTDDDHDGAIDYFRVIATEDDFRIDSVTTSKLTYKGGEDEWRFFAPILIDVADKIQFRDAGLSIHSGVDGSLDFTTDGDFRFFEGATQYVRFVYSTYAQINFGAEAALQAQVNVMGAATGSDLGGSIRLGSALDYWNVITLESYVIRTNQDDLELGLYASGFTAKLKYVAEDEWQFLAPVLMDVADKVSFRDNGQFINSDEADVLNLNATTRIDFDQYVRFGSSGTSGHGLSAQGDVLVRDDLEVNGELFADGGIRLDSATSNSIRFDEGGNRAFSLIGDYAQDQALIAVNGEVGHHVVLCKQPSKDYDHADQTNPTLFIHSITDPDTQNDEWISFTHNVTDGVIAVGSGILSIPEGMAIGDGGTTDYIAVQADGAIIFHGEAGLCFGEIYVRANAAATAVGVAGTYVQFLGFAVDGESNNATPDHTNDHVTVTQAGRYYVSVSIHVETEVAGAADEFGFEVRTNNGTNIFNNLHAHRVMAGGGGDVGSVGLSGIVDLGANDTVELWVTNEDDTDGVIVADCTLTVIQVAGT